jgi:protein ImuB
MLWLCIRLPKLSLEAQAAPGASQGGPHGAALTRLALWAQQWSSHVSRYQTRDDAELFGAAAHPALWLEVGGSLALFGGVTGLRTEISTALELLGYSGELAIAPTPRAAQLLTQAPEPRAVLERPLLAARLSSLPLHWLALPEPALRALRSAGLRRIGAVLALPPAALARRFGPATSLYLQRLMGDAPDPLPTTPLPARYHAGFEFAGEVTDHTALLFPLQRLLYELQGYLRARDCALHRCQLRLRHRGRRDERADTLITLSASQPTRDAAQLLALARERLARLVLPAPVRELHLEADEFSAPAVLQGDFFSRDSESAQQLQQVLDRLCARLGAKNIHCLATLPEHRPERAWQAGTADVSGSGRQAILTERFTRSESKSPDATAHHASALPARPCWLLREPINVSAPTQVLSGPERIESGWWDGGDVARDYYLARSVDGARQWVYQDLRSNAWYLQGLWA